MSVYMKDFYNVVASLGEPIYVMRNDIDGTPKVYPLKACLTNATQAAYSLVDREYLFKGDMTLPDEEDCCNLAGLYVKRDLLPDRDYVLISVIAQPINNRIAYIYIVECNDEIDLCEATEIEDEFKNVVQVFKPYEKGVKSYWTTVLRSNKVTNDGLLDQTIYTALFPARYKISPFQRIIRKTYANGEYKNVNYQVESVNTDLMNVNPNNGEVTGVISVQLTEDLRTEQKNIDELQDNGMVNNG